MRKLNWKKTVAVSAALALCVGTLAGCGSSASSSTAASSEAASSTAASEVSSEEADEMAAKNVADLIDAIYVQERNENTDEQCKAAKDAWDALTDAQKELVEGEEADPDYFGRDTGDASKDDPRNEDNIGDNELLVVSFGTSFNDSRVKDIKGRPLPPIGLSAVHSPLRSSSTMSRLVTARRSTTCSRPWTVPLPTASRIWSSSPLT